MSSRCLTIGHLYPHHMNLYGDRGNVIALVRRAEWRGIAARVVEVEVGDRVSWADLDVVFMGGGEDRDQEAVADDFRARAHDLVPLLDEGLPMLAICGAYQLMGEYYLTARGERVPGVGYLPVYTVAAEPRLIGNVVAELFPLPTGEPVWGRTVVGFENHGGRTYLNAGGRPLARVVAGHGNNGTDRTEGIIRGHVIGTYLHGSLLPKNPHLADLLLGWAMRRRGWSVPAPLDDELEWTAHRVMSAREGKKGLAARGS